MGYIGRAGGLIEVLLRMLCGKIRRVVGSCCAGFAGYVWVLNKILLRVDGLATTCLPALSLAAVNAVNTRFDELLPKAIPAVRLLI